MSRISVGEKEYVSPTTAWFVLNVSVQRSTQVCVLYGSIGRFRFVQYV